MPAFRPTGEELLLDLSRGVRVVRATFETEDGERFERDVIRHPGAVAVVPVLDDGRAVLVRQYRVSVGAEMLEIPAGIRDIEGEPTEITARRELVEEAGYEATSLVLLTAFRAAVGLLDETCWVYLATGLTPCDTDRQGHEEEAMTVEHVALDDVPALVASGELTDAKTILGLLLAREHLRNAS